MTRVFIGVGSNIRPEASIRAAIRLLASRVQLVDMSTFYRTPAQDRPEQPDYINGVVAIETNVPPVALKHEVLRPIERCLGRRRSDDKLAPRPIDLDILLYGSRRMRTTHLRLPAEDIEKRAFVAVPLAEIAPEIRAPGTRRRVREIAAQFFRSQMTPLALTNDLRRVADICARLALRRRRGWPSRPGRKSLMRSH